MQNEGVWFLGDSVQLSRTSHRNPPATGLRPAALSLPPLAFGHLPLTGGVGPFGKGGFSVLAGPFLLQRPPC